MTAPLPLLYTHPVPLDAVSHRSMALTRTLGYQFAAGTHAIPVNMVEFAQLCGSYPIVFSADGLATPVAILGLKAGQNLFVTPEGKWREEAGYIPAYLRRYPFIFAEVSGTDQLTLCVDDAPGIRDDSSDLRIFTEDGKPTPMASSAMEFCKSFHAATLQSRPFSKALAESGLLVAREAEIPLPGGQPAIRFSGFMVVDEAKFAALPAETLALWHQNGWLGAIYAHLISLSQWLRLARLHTA